MGTKGTESLVVDFSRACYLRGRYDLADTLLRVHGDRIATMMPELHGFLSKLTDTEPPQLPHPITPRPRQWRCVATGTGPTSVFFITAPTLEAARDEARLRAPNYGALDITEEA